MSLEDRASRGRFGGGPGRVNGDAPGTRTPNLVIKSHLLCQIELARHPRFYQWEG